ncbi:hypothetical protein ACQKFQ_06110, partial [Staphylococcus capitis]
RAIRENFKVHKEDIIAKDIVVIARHPARDMTSIHKHLVLYLVIQLIYRHHTI